MKFYLGDEQSNPKALIENRKSSDYKTAIAVIKAVDEVNGLHNADKGLIVEADNCNLFEYLHNRIIYNHGWIVAAYQIPLPIDKMPENIENVYLSNISTDGITRQWVYAKYKGYDRIWNWCLFYDSFHRFGYTSEKSFEGHEV